MAAVSWGEVEEQAAGLAATVRSCFDVRKHATLATLRRDGRPRISGTEVEFSGGQLWIGSMAGAVKALDLQRDPRLALHSPTVDPPEGDEAEWAGEAKLSGVAVEQPCTADGAHRFRIDVDEVVHTAVAGDELVITAWHAGRSVDVHHRG